MLALLVVAGLSARAQVNGTPTAAAPPQLPSGSIIAYAGEKVPAGWLLCDGSTRNAKDFPSLHTAIGTAWGNGDASGGSFSLPDMRGMFLRGVDENASADPDAAARTSIRNGGNSGSKVGSMQEDSYASHNHVEATVYTTKETGYYNDNAKKHPLGGTAGVTGRSNNNYNNRYHPYTSREGGSETRPKNVYVHYIIKI